MAAVPAGVVIVDAGAKLAFELFGKSEMFENYRNYITYGITESVSFGNAALLAVSIGLLFLGSLLPDIDSEKSTLGRYFYLPVRHRTLTHSVLFLLPFIIGGVFWTPFLWLAFGMFTHLFCDSLSKAGVCWFWPVSKYRRYGSGAFVKREHWLKLYESGHWSEFVVLGLGYLIAAVLFSIAHLGFRFT